MRVRARAGGVLPRIRPLPLQQALSPAVGSPPGAIECLPASPWRAIELLKARRAAREKEKSSAEQQRQVARAVGWRLRSDRGDGAIESRRKTGTIGMDGAGGRDMNERGRSEAAGSERGAAAAAGAADSDAAAYAAAVLAAALPQRRTCQVCMQQGMAGHQEHAWRQRRRQR